MNARRYADLSDEQRAELEPLAQRVRANGVEPRWVIDSPGCAGARRRARQANQRAHKQARARTNRPKG